jgi:hypothetical protein
VTDDSRPARHWKRIADPVQRERVLAAHGDRCDRCGKAPTSTATRDRSPCPFEPDPCERGVECGIPEQPCWTPVDVVTLALEIDHILPWSQGGRTVDENLRPLCVPCHRSRGVTWDL